jgi:hypothetical protein
LNVPQAPELQDAVQTMPPHAVSLVTSAPSTSGLLICKDDGIAVVVLNLTPMGASTIVKLTLLVCEGFAVTVAVTVTAPLIGTMDGAA